MEDNSYNGVPDNLTSSNSGSGREDINVGTSSVKSSYNAPKLLTIQHGHDEKMLQIQHHHELNLLNKKLGKLGRFFGHEENSSKNITLVLVVFLLCVNTGLTIYFYEQDPVSSFVMRLWEQMFPIVTLALGYIFGRK